jgi:succinate-semialdehyde dehydrogenase/glutarate-semialdehyde dehydrogenase
MAYATTNPYTAEVVRTFTDATDAQVDAALTAADAAFQEWKHSTFATRSAVMRKAAALMRERTDEYAALLTLEMGKLYAEAKLEVALCADMFDYYGQFAEEHLAPRPIPSVDPGRYELQYVPQGIIFAVEPWNFPFYQVVRIAAPQLSAGNVIILKHASNVPQSAAMFDTLFADAGLPAGCFKNLYATRPQTSKIIADPRVRGVALTGSEAAGITVAKQAAEACKKSTLELGGADAFVVLADADIDKTTTWATMGRHWNGGQVCVSSKRQIVVDSVYDEFRAQYIAKVGALVAGDPMDPATQLAPLSSQGAKEGLQDQLDKAIANGATATVIGAPVPSQGSFFQPVLLENVTPDNPAYYEEFFGPVTLLFRAKDEDDAVRIANDSIYGLGGSVFGTDTVHAKQVAERIDTGMVFVNHPTIVKADVPFGGVKHSGYGRELTDLGITEFVNAKVVGVLDIDAPF